MVVLPLRSVPMPTICQRASGGAGFVVVDFTPMSNSQKPAWVSPVMRCCSWAAVPMEASRSAMLKGLSGDVGASPKLGKVGSAAVGKYRYSAELLGAATTLGGQDCAHAAEARMAVPA